MPTSPPPSRGSLPVIPGKVISLVDPVILENYRKRKASASSQWSIDRPIEELIELKKQNLQADVDLYEDAEKNFRQRQGKGKMTAQVFTTQCEELRSALSIPEKEKELRKISKSYKFLADDLQELKMSVSGKGSRASAILEEAYVLHVVGSVERAAPDRPGKRFDQGYFKEDLHRYYGSTRKVNGYREVYCLLTGWKPVIENNSVIAAHLVPKSFENTGLEFLFGVGDALLSDPKNGLPLVKNIENAIDCGFAVIVPAKGCNAFKIVLVDKAQAGNAITQTGNKIYIWRDIDNKELTFLNENRPAKRYLYFKFITTYLKWKRRNDDAKVQVLDSLGAKDILWASQGGYLRESLLKTLFRRAHMPELPEHLTVGLTFKESKYSASRPDEEEKMVGLDIEEAMKLEDSKPGRPDPWTEDDEDSEVDDWLLE